MKKMSKKAIGCNNEQTYTKSIHQKSKNKKRKVIKGEKGTVLFSLFYDINLDILEKQIKKIEFLMG